MPDVQPVNSPRYLYRCTNLKRFTLALQEDGTKERVISDALVYLKESHANWLGSTLCTKVPSDDPVLIGIRSVLRPNEETNADDAAEQTERYRKRVGGFRAKSFKLVAKGKFQLVYSIDDDNGNPVSQTATRKSISIGCPNGVSLDRFMTWIEGLPTNKLTQLSAIISPDGRRHQV